MSPRVLEDLIAIEGAETDTAIGRSKPYPLSHF